LTGAVTPHKGLATKRKGGSRTKTKRKRSLKRRNLQALSLRDARYRSRVVKGAKVYSRKSKERPEEENEA
jgi:hypothetical protein